jgi:hypothetical protein
MNLEDLQRYLDVDEDEVLSPGAPVNLVPRLVQSTEEVVPEAAPQVSISERIQEIELAQKLGYLLCKCSWPPQVMVLTGTDHVYRCKRCSRVREV